VRKFTIFLLAFCFVVLVVGVFWSLSSVKLVSPFSGGVVIALFSQSTLGSTGSDSYYEERCIDVSQYYVQGYTNLRLDSHGCQIVGLSMVTGYMDLGQNVYGNCEYQSYRSGGSPSCPSGNYNTKWGCVECRYYTVDERGGFERVLNYCTYAQNDLLVAESFAGGQSITKTSLRYPMKSFCRGHPSIVTDDGLKTSVTSTNIPQDLIDGKSVTISSGQTLTVFYIIENNANLPTICSPDSNLALDVNNTAVCKSTLGFTYLCSEGQFDALTGTCVVQPESKTLCAQGRFDTVSGMCIYNPPVQVDCGSSDCFYSVDRDVCSCAVREEFTCNAGFTLYEPSQSECTGTWELCPQCPVDKICSTDICEARCSVGQKCVWANPLAHDCLDANATIHSDGTCTIDGQTIIVCPTDSKFNHQTNLCEFAPESITVCAEGSTMTTNSLTGVSECIVSAPPIFHDCGVDEVLSNGSCVKQVIVYVPQTNNVTIYSQVNKGCQGDSDCVKIADSYKCNVPVGVCQTQIYSPTNYTPVYVAIGIVVVIGSLSFVFSRMLYKKKGRKR
jgi:hypothetical protein